MNKKFLSIEDINNINYKINENINDIEKLKKSYVQKMNEYNNNINYLKNILNEKCNHKIEINNYEQHYCSICFLYL